MTGGRGRGGGLRTGARGDVLPGVRLVVDPGAAGAARAWAGRAIVLALERDAEGRCKYMGFVAEFGGYRVYHSGDTIWYDGMVEILKPFAVDVAFLPINGNKPERRVAGNLSAEEAARLGVEIDAKLVIPHHYDLFTFNTEDPQEFVKYAQHYKTPYRVLKIGEGVRVE